MIIGDRIRCLLLVLALAAHSAAWAGKTQDADSIRKAAASFLAESATGAYPGTHAKVEVGPLDPRLNLSNCVSPSFYLVPGSRLWGNGNLGAICDAGGSATFYLSYQIRLSGPVLLARRPMPTNYSPKPQDLLRATIEYRNAPGRYPLDPDKLQDARLLMPIAKGAPITINMLRTPPLIRAGQKVRILVNGAGFQVTQEGVAQQQAGAGDLLRIKLANGRYIQGEVQSDGTVRVNP